MEVKGREIGPDGAEAALDRPSLYELANIDRDRYTIVGVDGPTTAIVYVIDRLEHSIAELGQSGSEIPVWGSVSLSRRLKTSSGSIRPDPHR